MISDKQVVQQIVALCKAKDIRTVVISPGSRNAPLTISFNRDPFFTCLAIPDERVAGFVALGMAQATGKPVVVACTSGSAVLNYYPAVAEAFYQQVPLVVLSADRPTAWTDQADGQTIRQVKVLDQHTRYSASLLDRPTSHEDLWYNNRLINEALNAASGLPNGPVHLNVPFHEPLYQTVEQPSVHVTNQHIPAPELSISELEWAVLADTWKKSSRRLLLAGQALPGDMPSDAWDNLTSTGQAVLLTETTSNLHLPGALPCIDRVINTVESGEHETLYPDLLVTFGGAVVSKKIKALLRKGNPAAHWHIDMQAIVPDTYQALTHHIRMEPAAFLTELNTRVAESSTEYAGRWQQLHQDRQRKHNIFADQAPYSDWWVFDRIHQLIPPHEVVHLGNSSPVRYAQLFEWDPSVAFLGNRGTSGIDGSSSTAVGYALRSTKQVTLITGDVSFFYDSNAFFHQHLPANLRIIVIQNGGGNIFRIIEGPRSTDELADYFETHHTFSAAGIAQTFGVSYLSASSKTEVEAGLRELYDPQRQEATLLEIFTPRLENDGVLTDYFNALKSD